MHLPEILEKIRKNGCVLMLDFDGTLSPIVARHKDAVITESLRSLLKRCFANFPVAIISGRSLNDVKRRIGIRGISYAGSHGLEFKMQNSSGPLRVNMPKATLRAFRSAKNNIRKTLKDFSDVSIEDKKLSYAIHYRSLSPALAKLFRKKAASAVAPYLRAGTMRVINDLYTFDMMPDVNRTKGECAKYLYSRLRENRNAVPIYIGDGVTDEDAFKAFKTGVTIRVGKKMGSSARYFFRNRIQVDLFLSSMADLATHDSQKKK